VCTAVLSFEPGRQLLLLAGLRDEFTDRLWDPPGRHWPDHPDLIGGRDRQAGGTWLAVWPDRRRVSCVLNGTGEAAPLRTRRSRGGLPLRAAAGEPLDRAALADTDPFRLLTADPGQVTLQCWDGRDLTERRLPAGLHLVVNSGLAGDLAAPGRPHELRRIAHFRGRFAAAEVPEPRPGQAAADAWGSWLPLVNGDGIGPSDERALIVRRELAGGRTWGTTSISLVALAPGWLRYDFTADPGNAAAWYPVSPST